MSTNGCGPGGTLGAHTITLGMVQPHLGVLALPQVDLPALALSAWVVPSHPSASLGQCDSLMAAEDNFFCFLCVCLKVHIALNIT